MLFSWNSNTKNSDNGKKSRDILPKVLSVIAAVILWFYVIDVQTTTEEKTIYNVPVAIENFDNTIGLDIVSGRDYVVDVVVRGTKSELTELSQDDVYAYVDLSGISFAGSYKVSVNVVSRSGASVVNQTVSEVNIGIDKTVAKPVPVVVNAEYSIEEDVYEKGEEILSFDTVYISGPENVVNTVAKAEARIDLGKLNSKITSRVTLVPVDYDGNVVTSPYVKFKDTAVTVTVPVYKTATKKVDVSFYNVNYSYDYVLSHNEIKIKGDASVVDSIESIKLESITETEPCLLIKRLSLPEGIIAYDMNGATLDSVRVSIKSVKHVSGNSENE